MHLPAVCVTIDAVLQDQQGRIRYENNMEDIAGVVFYTLGVVGWFYVGGWMILRGPVRGVILAHMAGDLSLIKLAVALVQGFVYLSLAGGVWCIGYMLSDHFRKDE